MTTISNRQKAFAILFKELYRWDVKFFTSRLPGHFPLVPLEDFIHERHERVTLYKYPDQTFTILGVNNISGVFHAYDTQGKSIHQSYKRVRAQDFFYNPYRVNVGSVGIVPSELGGNFTSPAYVIFYVDESKVIPKFLELVMRSDWYNSTLRAATAGSVRQNLTIDLLKSLEIPLPPLQIQQEIITEWEEAQREVTYTQREIAELEEHIELDFLADLGITKPKRDIAPKVFSVMWQDMERWSVMFNQLRSLIINISIGNYTSTTLGRISTVSYGIQKSPANRPSQHARPYLRVANVQRGELDLTEIKYIDVPDSELPAYRLEPNDLLICEGNSAELVGRPAIWKGEITDCVHQNHILKVRIDISKAIPEYILEYMHTSPARNYFRSRAKFTTNLASINSNDLRDLPVPLPPLNVQQDLIDKISMQRSNIALLKAKAENKEEQAKVYIETIILG